jgi:hypothetical protein
VIKSFHQTITKKWWFIPFSRGTPLALGFIWSPNIFVKSMIAGLMALPVLAKYRYFTRWL